MVRSSLDLQLKCFVKEKKQKETEAKSYIKVKLYDGCYKKFGEHIAQLDTEGYANLHIDNVRLRPTCLRFQIFNHRKYLPDNKVGEADVCYSDLQHSYVKGRPKKGVPLVPYQVIDTPTCDVGLFRISVGFVLD